MEYFKNAEIRDIQSDKHLEAMHKMTGFIQKNYQSRISIGDIAGAGFVCRSRCCEIFKKYLGKTPNEYLTEYRISKGIKMLKSTISALPIFHMPADLTAQATFRKPLQS